MTAHRPRTLVEEEVHLAGGRCLRIRLVRSADGKPEELHLAEGWSSGGRDDHRWRLGPLPGHILPDLLAALGRLAEVEP